MWGLVLFNNNVSFIRNKFTKHNAQKTTDIPKTTHIDRQQTSFAYESLKQHLISCLHNQSQLSYRQIH